jgi:hypothetical protein
MVPLWEAQATAFTNLAAQLIEAHGYTPRSR